MTAASKAQAIHQHAKTLDRLCVEIETTLAQLAALEPEYRAELTDADERARSGHGFSGFAPTARAQLSLAVAGKWLNSGNRGLAAWLSFARPQHFQKDPK